MRAHALQLEKVRLDAETTLKRLEAESALARAAAAQTEAAYKADRAAWVTSVDAQKFEVRSCGCCCCFFFMFACSMTVMFHRCLPFNYMAPIICSSAWCLELHRHGVMLTLQSAKMCRAVAADIYSVVICCCTCCM